MNNTAFNHKKDWAECYAYDLVSSCNFGKRKGPHVKNGTLKEQYYGMLAQTIMCWKLGCELPSPSDGSDGGVDFIINNKKVDLKTMIRTSDVDTGYMIGNLMKSQTINSSTDYYVFASFNISKNALELVGFCKKEEVAAISTEVKAGTIRKNRAGKEIIIGQDIYEVDYRKLHQINSFDDLNRLIQ